MQTASGPNPAPRLLGKNYGRDGSQKPELRAYSELVAARLKRHCKTEERRDGYERLSPLQLEIFEKAIAFSSGGV